MKLFVTSLVDPFFVDCIIVYQHPSTDSISKFHDIHGIQECFWWCYVHAFSAKNILVVVAVMISPSLIESSMFFFQIKLLIYCNRIYQIQMGQDITNANDVHPTNVLRCSMPTALSAENITAVVAATVVIINPSHVFYSQNHLHL